VGNIVLLDDLTINKIAAGEVIERPASVIKELVENSIDAGATTISVEMKNGGISYIRVTDNGKGIAADDLEIAFERHATSKIRSADDLEKVKSMGFRGEALASIAAISKVEMKSKTLDSKTGYRVVVEGGNILDKEEAGCPNGTTITIENLFYNTPVRYKFLKKDFTEAGYIEDAVTRIALIHPEIAIKLINSGKTIIQTSGNGEMKDVIYNIYGKDVAENILEVEYEYEDIRVKGVVGKPSISRSNRSNQLFFVNKRYIKDKTLTSSAEQAYKGLITIGKFGFLILNLEINPQKVDVNVHPAKLEVRFEEESKVFKAVYHSIKDTLLKTELVEAREKVQDDDANIPTYNPVINTTVNQVEEAEGGLFKRILAKKEENENEKEDDKDNIIEALYNKKNSIDMSNVNTSYSTGNGITDIVKKLEEIKKSVDTYKLSNIEDNKETEEKKIEENLELQEESKEVEDTVKIDTTKINEMNLENQDTIVMTKDMQEELMKNIQNQETQVINVSEIKEKIEEEKSEFKLEEIQEEREVIRKDFGQMYSSIFGVNAKQEEIEEKDDELVFNDVKIPTGENLSIFSDKDKKNVVPPYKFIGIAFNTYILIELNKELYMIDQHAAHERILYEKVKENYYNSGDKESQLMLLPDIITLTHKEMAIAEDNMDIFEKAGFILEEFGENTIKLSGVPNICLNLDTKELFLEALDEINTVARTAKQEIEERFIATVACKAAVKAGMVLSKEEVENLIVNMLKLPNPFTCPHGRPTAIKMSKNDIEKKFERRK